MRLSLVLLVCAVALLLFVPALWPADPMATDTASALQPPSVGHLFGTDAFGRDSFVRFWYGGRATLALALVSVLVGWGGGVVAALMSRAAGRASPIIDLVLDALLALPSLVFALAILTLTGAGATYIALAVGIAQIAPTAAFTRDAIRQTESQPYMLAARSLGGGSLWRLRVHILPNLLPIINGYGLLVFTYAVLGIAGLQFLGFGSAPGTPEWGLLLYEGRLAYRDAPWLSLAPGLGITVLVGLCQWALAGGQLRQIRG